MALSRTMLAEFTWLRTGFSSKFLYTWKLSSMKRAVFPNYSPAELCSMLLITKACIFTALENFFENFSYIYRFLGC
jgi:hypothetical protein